MARRRIPVVAGLDLSLRRSAAVAIPPRWDYGFDTLRVHVVSTEKETHPEMTARIDFIAESIVDFLRRSAVTNVFVEEYSWSRSENAGQSQIKELGGVLKNKVLFELGLLVTPVNESAYRKLLFGKLPRKDKKKFAYARLATMGMPEDWGLDEADALGVGNLGRHLLGLPALSAGWYSGDMARTAKKVAKSLPKEKSKPADEFTKTPLLYRVEVVDGATLKPHPRNYKTHPKDQLAHIESSLREHGFYKNVVVAREGTILAGHGVVEAAMNIGMTQIPIRRVDLAPDSPLALKIVAGDNELGKFAESDDRRLSEILKTILDNDPSGLLGTGYGDQTLAALLMVTRHASEIRDINEAAEWIGLPEYDEDDGPKYRLVVSFVSEDDRRRFVDEKKMKIIKMVGFSWSARWPAVLNEDASSIRFAAKKGSKKTSEKKK